MKDCVTYTTTEYYHYTEGQLSYVKDSTGVITGKYSISYTKDIRGSAKTLISQNGKKLVSYDYNDYGETTVRTAADNTAKTGYNNHLCYTGGVYDKATGMYYLNARYYAPSVAGFITQDSYRGTYEDPKTWNLYGYCAGNPVGYTDPTGHFAFALPWVIPIGAELFKDLVVSIAVTCAAAKIVEDTVETINECREIYYSKSAAENEVKPKEEPAAKGKSKSKNKSKKKSKEHMLGENGVPISSKTVWHDGKARLDVENPNPGQRPGQIHYHHVNGEKYIYDIISNEFKTNGLKKLSNKVYKKLMSNNKFKKGIKAALELLNEASDYFK